MAAPIWTEAELEGALGPEVLAMTDGELRSKLRDIQNETFQMEQEAKRIQANINKKKKDIEDNARKIEMNKQLPYLVGNIVEVIETPEDADEAEDGAFQDRCASDFANLCNFMPYLTPLAETPHEKNAAQLSRLPLARPSFCPLVVWSTDPSCNLVI